MSISIIFEIANFAAQHSGNVRRREAAALQETRLACLLSVFGRQCLAKAPPPSRLGTRQPVPVGFSAQLIINSGRVHTALNEVGANPCRAVALAQTHAHILLGKALFVERVHCLQTIQGLFNLGLFDAALSQL